jgi:hypothetical protein
MEFGSVCASVFGGVRDQRVCESAQECAWLRELLECA